MDASGRSAFEPDRAAEEPSVSYFPSEQTRAGAEPRIASGLLGKIFGLLAFSLVFATVGGYVGSKMSGAWFLPIVVLYFGLFFAVQKLRDREGINLVLLYAFAFSSGLLIGPVVGNYVSAGLGGTVLEAAAITGVMTAGLGAFALTTKRDFSGLTPYIFVGILGLFAAMIANIWVGGSMLSVAIGWVGALLFSALLVVHVQRAKYAPDTMGNAIVLTLGIYLDIVNLFLLILRILQGGRR
jgi:FtsH-binding integral membrane protein